MRFSANRKAPPRGLEESVTAARRRGHEVGDRAPFKRLLLGEARLVYGLAPLFRRDLFEHVVAWPSDFRVNDAGTFEAYRKVYGGMEAVPQLGSLAQGSFSVEQALALRPDLVVMPLGFLAHAEGDGLLAKFAAASVPVVFVDFREQPLDNAVPSAPSPSSAPSASSAWSGRPSRGCCSARAIASSCSARPSRARSRCR